MSWWQERLWAQWLFHGLRTISGPSPSPTGPQEDRTFANWTIAGLIHYLGLPLFCEGPTANKQARPRTSHRVPSNDPAHSWSQTSPAWWALLQATWSDSSRFLGKHGPVPLQTICTDPSALPIHHYIKKGKWKTGTINLLSPQITHCPQLVSSKTIQYGLFCSIVTTSEKNHIPAAFF